MAPAVTVKLLVQVVLGVQFVGLKLAVAPVGKPLILKLTASAVPAFLVTVITWAEVVWPWAIDCEVR